MAAGRKLGRKKRNTLIGAGGVLAAVAITFYGISNAAGGASGDSSVGSMTTADLPVTTDLLIAPSDEGRGFGHKIDVRGCMHGSWEAVELWLISRPFQAPQVGNYHPHDRIIPGSDGCWSFSRIGVGEESNLDLGLRVLVISAPRDASIHLRSYQKTAQDRGWPGMPSLPQGVRVIRADEIQRSR
jgi:hypothetical protein